MDEITKISVLSWNVNSIRARLELLLKVIADNSPDIILLQETKVTDDLFPFDAFENLPYNISVHGQKSYNGVAIFSKSPIEDVEFGTFSSEARLINCFTYGLYVSSIYVINGQEVGCNKYYDKLNFFDYLKDFFHDKSKDFSLIGGDFNVTSDDHDVYNPKLWKERITSSRAERQKFHEFLDSGYKDTFRSFNPLNIYTWWDYRHNAIETGRGLRLDYLLSSPSLSPHIEDIKVLTSIRRADRTSDHAPLLCTLNRS